MRKFKSSLYGKEVDLDNSKTYKHLPKKIKELRDRMFKEIGYAILYMDHFPDRKEFFQKKKKKSDCGYEQRQRVYNLIKNFAENESENYENIMWYKEQIFLFEDETENM